MLLSLIPLNQWTNHAAWRSPQQIDNFIYIPFNKNYLDYIVLDGKKLKEQYSDKIKYIPGTEIAYLCSDIAAGDHLLTVEGLPEEDKNTAIFSCYAYGNWDRSKDGFAYGYPVGINYALNYKDTLLIAEEQSDCGNVTITAEAYSTDYPDPALLNVFPIELNNYELKIADNPTFTPGNSKKVVFTLSPSDLTKSADCSIKIKTKTGRTQLLHYEYKPEKIGLEPDEIDFGKVLPDTTICGKTFVIINVSDSKPLTVNAFRFLNEHKGYRINYASQQYPITLPFTLQPGERKIVEMCVDVPVNPQKNTTDSLVVELDCINSQIIFLNYTSTEPIAWIGDANWENIHVGALVSQEVQIKNEGDAELVLYRISWPDEDKDAFPKVKGLPCDSIGGAFNPPLRLGPYADTTFLVYYRPPNNGTHKTTAIFLANTTERKLNSVWTGTSYTGVAGDKQEWNSIITPNPATDYIEIAIDNHTLKDAVKVYDVLGVCIATHPLTPSREGVAIRLDVSGLAAGVYFVRVGSKIYKFVKM
jgi:hypothetical protein